MTTEKCKKIFTTSNFVTDPKITAAKSMISKKFRLIGIMFLILVILLYYIIRFINEIIDSVSMYNKNKNKNESYKSSITNRLTISSSKYDNENYENPSSDNLVDEYFEFNKRIDNIKNQYSDFNEKVTRYQMSNNGGDVTDTIDKNILMKSHDDY